MIDTIVIGGGIFGQVVAKALREKLGQDVYVFDANRPESGSRPAACLMRPSWYSSMGRDVHEPSLQLLSELYDVQDVHFKLQPLKQSGRLGSVTVKWIPPQTILNPSTLPITISKIQDDNTLVAPTGEEYQARHVVVAAGIWTEQLLPQYKQQGQKGISFLWWGRHIQEPFIHPYAPYRQFVAFNRGDAVWAGDGQAIKQENWTLERAMTCHERAVRHLGPLGFDGSICESILGVRPYAKGHKPCLVEQVRPGLWVASGGAKNGTVAAGYCAHRILEGMS